jgi:hypothetical protein
MTSKTVPLASLLLLTLSFLLCSCNIRERTFFRMEKVASSIEELYPGGDSLVGISVSTDFHESFQPIR